MTVTRIAALTLCFQDLMSILAVCAPLCDSSTNRIDVSDNLRYLTRLRYRRQLGKDIIIIVSLTTHKYIYVYINVSTPSTNKYQLMNK